MHSWISISLITILSLFELKLSNCAESSRTKRENKTEIRRHANNEVEQIRAVLKLNNWLPDVESLLLSLSQKNKQNFTGVLRGQMFAAVYTKFAAQAAQAKVTTYGRMLRAIDVWTVSNDCLKSVAELFIQPNNDDLNNQKPSPDYAAYGRKIKQLLLDDLSANGHILIEQAIIEKKSLQEMINT